MAKNDPKLELLRSIPGLGTHRDKDLARMAPLLDEVHREQGDILVHEGRPGSEAYLIVDGRASVSIRGEALTTLGPGEFVGEMALLDHSPRSATVTADTPMRLLVIDPRSFSALLDQPRVGWRVAQRLAERLRRAEGAPTYDDQVP